MIEIEEVVSLFKEEQCNCCKVSIRDRTLFNLKFSNGQAPTVIRLCEDCMNQLHDLIEDTRPTYLTFD